MVVRLTGCTFCVPFFVLFYISLFWLGTHHGEVWIVLEKENESKTQTRGWGHYFVFCFTTISFGISSPFPCENRPPSCRIEIIAFVASIKPLKPLSIRTSLLLSCGRKNRHATFSARVAIQHTNIVYAVSRLTISHTATHG